MSWNRGVLTGRDLPLQVAKEIFSRLFPLVNLDEIEERPGEITFRLSVSPTLIDLKDDLQGIVYKRLEPQMPAGVSLYVVVR